MLFEGFDTDEHKNGRTLANMAQRPKFHSVKRDFKVQNVLSYIRPLAGCSFVGRLVLLEKILYLPVNKHTPNN